MCIRQVSQILGWIAATCALGTVAGCAGTGSYTPIAQVPFWTSPIRALAWNSNGPAWSCDDKKARGLAPTLGVAKPVDSNIRPVVWRTDNSTTDAITGGEQASVVVPDEIPAPNASASGRNLSLRDAVNTALLRNPDAITARANGPVNDATRAVTATYPWNPAVQVQVDPSPARKMVAPCGPGIR